ncbi:hypothetical protein D3C71_1659060 [compost metagenome]
MRNQCTAPVGQVSQSNVAWPPFARLHCGRCTSAAAKHHKLQQGVPHHPVAAMQATRHLACTEQAGDTGATSSVDRDTAVLVVKRRTDQQRLQSRVNAAAMRQMRECYQSVVKNAWLTLL